MHLHGSNTLALLFAIGYSLLRSVPLAAQEIVDGFGQVPDTFEIEFVPVGNPGNADVSSHPTGIVGGRVDYEYRMGKYEISESQVESANRVGRLLITVSQLGAQMPATHMDHYSRLRFVNWLNETSGHHPAYNITDNGEWRLWSTNDAWQLGGQNLFRHKAAFYFLPSWDEWYKAAFYEPGTAKYSRFAYGSDAVPIPLPVPGGTNSGACVYAQPHDINGMPPPGPGDPTYNLLWQGAVEVKLAGGPSPYGTIAQNGNVNEILETANDGVNDDVRELLMLRGGWWYRPASVLAQGGGDNLRPWHDPGYHGGFRVASVPIPSGDSDQDGVPDIDEYVAGTDPFDPTDLLLLRVSNSLPTEISFPTKAAPAYGYMDPQRWYALEHAADPLSQSWAEVEGYSRILGTNQVVTYQMPEVDTAVEYFRLRVWIEAGLTPQPNRGEVTTDLFGHNENSFVIDFVAVGDPGNVNDPVAIPYPMGGVSYPYRIGKFEVSEEIINKASAEGRLGLSTSTRGPRKPATRLDFFERARFVNWLNESTGHHAAYKFNESGGWELWPEEESWDLGGVNRYRHKDAFYFIPSADEWYKPAFFDGDRYHLYSFGGDQDPLPVPFGRVGGTAVFGQTTTSNPADVDDAGGLSFYGTMAQSGNVSEYLETAFDGRNDSVSVAAQVRGGHWASGTTGLRSTAGGNNARPNSSADTLGFRVAARVLESPGR